MMEQTINVTLFCGGRGASTIISALSSHPQVNLSLLVNCYDDGLSTGRLRRFVGDMLGPSDVRKNIASLMPTLEASDRSLKFLLEYRFEDGFSSVQAHKVLDAFINRSYSDDLSDHVIFQAYDNLSIKQSRQLSEFCRVFLDYESEQFTQGIEFDFGDCSIGNILFTGCFLQCDNFNTAVENFKAFCNLTANVLNITDGEYLVLSALNKEGKLFDDEASIVAPQTNNSIEDIYLIDKYLSEDQVKEISVLSTEDKKNFLNQLHVNPSANVRALEALQNADLIIYGPGTQSSSLLPSYLTVGIAEAIQNNLKAEKIFISNIEYDHDIHGKTVNELISDFHANMSRKSSVSVDLSKLITKAFIHQADTNNLNEDHRNIYLNYNLSDLTTFEVIVDDWRRDGNKHSGEKIAAKMLSVVDVLLEKKLAPYRHMVSVVVPVLNEEKFIGHVLRGLEEVSFAHLNLNKEIIVVDGGSSDESIEIAKRFENVRVYKVPNCLGRGDAIRYGIDRSHGCVICLFPSDNEYNASDIHSLVKPIINNEFHLVFGSRSYKTNNVSINIKKIYGEGKYVQYIVSKYGGMLLSMMSLFLYNRFITDPFTTLKAFDSEHIRSMKLQSRGIDMVSEVIAKASKNNSYILEVPVEYNARSKKEGKKTTLMGGFSTLWAMVFWKFRK